MSMDIQNLSPVAKEIMERIRNGDPFDENQYPREEFLAALDALEGDIKAGLQGIAVTVQTLYQQRIHAERALKTIRRIRKALG